MHRRLTLILAGMIPVLMVAAVTLALSQQSVSADVPAPRRDAVAQALTMTVVGTGQPDQMQPLFDDFSTKTGISVAYEMTEGQSRLRNCQANGDCPDVALVPWPGLLKDLATEGTVVDLSSFVSSTVLSNNYTSGWIDLGKVDDTLYGVWYQAGNKSIVWHDPSEFTNQGWSTPTTWSELLSLSDQISNTTGTAPWSIGSRDPAAAGWPLTDWFEDILLHSAGPDVYDDLVAHDVPWTHTEVISAMTYFGDIFGNEHYQLGGKQGTLDTHWYEALLAPFQEPPQAYLHHQANFAQGILSNQFPTQTAGTDYGLFPFPTIDPAHDPAVLAAGNLAMAFNDDDATQKLINYLITTDAADVWISNGNISPNRNADFNLYGDPNTRAAAEWLINANSVSYDLSDQLSSELNRYLWSQMDDLVMAAPDPDETEDVLARIERKASGDLSVGLVIDGPTLDPGGIQWVAYQGLLRADTELGALGTVYTSTGPSQYEPNLQQCANDGHELCISFGGMMASATVTAAHDNPGTAFAILDAALDTYPDNVRGIVFVADEVGYLAGTLAGLMTESDVLGVIGGFPIPVVDAFAYGFRNGAQCANPAATVHITYTYDFVSQDAGARVAQALIAEGADVIFAPAGGAGVGAVLTATQSGAWGIGVDSDYYTTVFESGAVPGAEKLLSSAVKRLDNAVFDTVEAVISDTFTSGTQLYDLQAGGVGLAPFHEAADAVSQEVEDQIQSVEQGIINGTIDIDEPCRSFVYLPLVVRQD